MPILPLEETGNPKFLISNIIKLMQLPIYGRGKKNYLTTGYSDNKIVWSLYSMLFLCYRLYVTCNRVILSITGIILEFYQSLLKLWEYGHGHT